ncbi:MAG TPA: sulfatase [Thermoanaerobaculia bacterium]|nr:sulfatase [Thermoanaerobaculia bacterium]
MRRFGRCAAAAALLLVLAGCSGHPHQRTARRDNVVVVVIDTLRQDHLATYGYARDTAPFLGELARQGAVFDGVTPAPWTKPATLALLTGLHPVRHQAFDRLDALPAAAVTLAQRLRGEGYQTFAASANGWVSRAFGFDRGFDTFLYRDSLKSGELNRQLLPMLGRLKAPFFLYVHYIDPHAPYTPDRGWDGKPLPEPLRSRPVTIEELDATHFVHRSPELMARARDLYDGEIRQADEGLRALVSTLARQGLMKNTVLVVAADHGEELGEHGRMSHGQTVYQEVLRVPLVIRAPGLIAAGQRLGRASLLDVVPTLLDLLGVRRPENDKSLDGVSLAGLLTQGLAPATDDRPFLSHLDFVDGTGLALTQGRWKLVLGKNPYRKELFDLRTDPAETHNLLGEPGSAEPFQRLSEELARRYNLYSRASLERTTVQVQGDLQQRLAALGYVEVRASHARHVPRRVTAPDSFPNGNLGWAGAGSVGPCVDLSQQEALPPPLLAGWYESDGTGRWSAPTGTLLLGAPGGQGPSDVDVRGINFRPAPVDGSLRVNGVAMQRFTLAPGPFELAVPVTGVALTDPSLVEIATDTEYVPSRHGDSKDDRSLGLFVTRVCLRTAGGTGR